MKNLKSKQVLLIVVGAFAVIMGLFIVGDIVINKVADRVIERLEKDYCPSPYGPGLDPDKVPVTNFHNRSQ